MNNDLKNLNEEESLSYLKGLHDISEPTGNKYKIDNIDKTGLYHDNSNIFEIIFDEFCKNQYLVINGREEYVRTFDKEFGNHGEWIKIDRSEVE